VTNAEALDAMLIRVNIARTAPLLIESLRASDGSALPARAATGQLARRSWSDLIPFDNPALSLPSTIATTDGLAPEVICINPQCRAQFTFAT